jgi:hypothetical protein
MDGQSNLNSPVFIHPILAAIFAVILFGSNLRPKPQDSTMTNM